MLLNYKNLLAADGSYKVNLMSSEQAIVCNDQPAGLHLRRDEKEDDVIPPGMIIIKEFLSQKECKNITDFADKQPGNRLQVMYSDPLTGKRISRPDDSRITDHVNIQGIQNQISTILEKACRNILAPHYDIDIEWYEKPTLLRYGPGGTYGHHSDSENWNPNSQTWNRFCDRSYSLLLYLNEEFTGGSLYFRNFDFRLTPTMGTLVAFPSDHRYVHRAEPVISGTRYAIVSWIVLKDKRYFTKGKPIPPHALQL